MSNLSKTKIILIGIYPIATIEEFRRRMPQCEVLNFKTREDIPKELLNPLPKLDKESIIKPFVEPFISEKTNPWPESKKRPKNGLKYRYGK